MYTSLTELFTAVADAIREKSGETAAIEAQDFPEKILDISTQSNSPGSVSSFYVSPGNGKTEITWTDPQDVPGLAAWAGTRIVRRTGGYPLSPEDGTLVVDSTVRGQYASQPYTDTGLTNGTEYFYRAFTYASDGSVNMSCGSESLDSAVPENLYTLGDMPVGTLVSITETEDGVASAVPYLLLEHNHYGSGETVLIRNSTTTGMHDIVTGPDEHLTARFSAGVVSQLVSVPISYRTSSGTNQTTARAFNLGRREVGDSSASSTTGTAFAYFTDNTSRKSADATAWVLRDMTRSAYYCSVSRAGGISDDDEDAVTTARPAVAISSAALISGEVNPDGSYDLIEEV